jgi:hypothetical protein
MMLILTSYANRYSGTVNVIDDPSIQVGNPIRIHLYDEHPFKNITWNRSSDTAKEQSMFDETIFPEQAVFYVTGIERNIDLSNTSTMTLQLKAGKIDVASSYVMDTNAKFMDLIFVNGVWTEMARG